MKPRGNSGSLLGLVAEAEAGLRDYFIHRPTQWWTEAREKLKDLPKTNFELGCDFAQRGLYRDAILRFRFVLYLRPNYPLAWYNLGCCYYRNGDKAKAAPALKKALAQQPDNRDALFMLSGLDPESVPQHLRPTRMPAEMVTGFFSLAAANYDAFELANQYQGGQLVFDALKPLLKVPSPVVVDFGCGTGIAARPWRATAKEITGIDLTPAMIAGAQTVVIGGQPLFERLVTADLTALGDAITPASADLILCVNTASYVGALEALMASAAQALKPGGLIAITTEPYAHGGAYGLSADTGRFGHSGAYVRALAEKSGFITAREQRIDLYPGITSQLQVFTKS
ncbi:MAG: methyltransferase domain-containing protein [Rickettsiales bacterium]